MQKYKSVVLIVLDGWGLSPSWGGNALVMNNPKKIDELWRTYPHTILQALGAIEYGNIIGESRLGHLMMGAGRTVSSFHTQIGEQIRSRKFYKNDTLNATFDYSKKNHSNIHFIGMVSDGGVHSDVDHLLALLEMAHRKDFKNVYIDAITDGIDSGPTVALSYIEKIQNKIKSVGIGQFSSIGGRDFAMDRDEHWDKIKKYYNTIIGNDKISYNSIEEAVSQNYREGRTDDYIEPGLIKDEEGKTNPIKDKDALVFFNFREDRFREIARVFLDQKFKKFLWHPKKIKDLYITTFIEYQKELAAKIVFPKKTYTNTLSEVLSRTGFKQIKLAESEKSTHVTSFFNGGREKPFRGEDIKIISSPNVKSFDTKPEMSAKPLAKAVIDAIKSKKYEFILVNFANVDMIAHTGNIIAVGQAVQVLDTLVSDIVKNNMSVGGVTMITADHGNAEQMVNINKKDSHERETLHTLNPVPFMLIVKEYKKNLIQTSVMAQPNTLSKIISASDNLADVAPTILEVMGIPKPQEMTGHSLLSRLE
jgi:2,3-bisphosphoglycerate-independent phosphoglycerate mutase